MHHDAAYFLDARSEILGNDREKAGLLSFFVDSIHTCTALSGSTITERTAYDWFKAKFETAVVKGSLVIASADRTGMHPYKNDSCSRCEMLDGDF